MSEASEVAERLLFIDGRRCEGSAGRYRVDSPIDGRAVASVSSAGLNDLNRAVQAAEDCQRTRWGTLTVRERADRLRKVADALEAHGEALAEVMMQEAGVWYGQGWGPGQSAYFRYYAGLAAEMPAALPAGEAVVIKEPVGVCGAIIPWNTTVHGVALKAAPALAAGNTVVVLAPPEAPSAVLMLAEVFERAGLPAGACNLLSGDGAVLGQALVEHPAVEMVAFTGSVAVGRQIMRTAAGSMKRLVLELGGKSPLVLFADVDVDQAAQCAMSCAFGNQGQSCCAVSRVLVHRSILDPLVQRMTQISRLYEPAYPREKGHPHVIGPLFNQKAFDRVEEYVRIGRQEGRLLFGGRRCGGTRFAGGYYYEPTAFVLPDGNGRLAREEVFGPVLAVIPFDDESQAVTLANGVDLGLSAAVWSQDSALLERVVPQIAAGTVWVNRYYQFSTHAPWGGFRHSGLGKEGGALGLEPYYRNKCVWWNRA
jgi:acyl-CoA reductase-like NAD-dependent aldehyde dehydrogenase